MRTLKGLRFSGQMVPVPPSPRTVRPVVSGAYGCESNLICKEKRGDCHSLVPRGRDTILRMHCLWVLGTHRELWEEEAKLPGWLR